MASRVVNLSRVTPYSKPVTVVSIGGKPIQKTGVLGTGAVIYTAQSTPTTQTTSPPQQLPTTQTTSTQKDTITTKDNSIGSVGGGSGGGRDGGSLPPITTEAGLKSRFEKYNYPMKIIGKVFDTSGSKKSPFEPQIPTTAVQEGRIGERSTPVYRTPTIQEMTPEQKYEYRTTQAQTELATQTYFKERQLLDKYQGQVDAGSISVEDANKRLNEEFNKSVQTDIRRFQATENKYYTDYVRESIRRESTATWLKGFTIGGIVALAPPTAYYFAGSGLASTYFNRKELKEQFKIAPQETIGSGLIGVSGALTGGLAVNKLVVEPYKAYKFDKEFSKTKFELYGVREKVGQNIFKAEYGTLKDVNIRGYDVGVRVQQTLKYSNNKLIPSATRVTYQLSDKTGFVSTKVYEGLVIPKYTGTASKGFGVQIKGAELPGFVGRSNLQLVSETTRYPGRYDLITGKFRVKTITKTFDNKPFVATDFVGISRTAGNTFKYTQVKGGKFIEIKHSQLPVIKTTAVGRGNVRIGIIDIGGKSTSPATNIPSKFISTIDRGSGGSPYSPPSLSTPTIASPIKQQTSSKIFNAVATPSKSLGSTGIITQLPKVTPTIATTQQTGLLGLSGVQITKSLTRQTPALSLSSSVVSRSNNLSTTSQAPTIIGSTRTNTITALGIGQAQAQGSRTIQRGISSSTFGRNTGISGLGFPGVTTPPPFTFNMNFGNFNFGVKSKKIKGRKQRKKYTPSYDALLFGIRGKAPKRITGLETRPIPKNFKWSFGRVKF